MKYLIIFLCFFSSLYSSDWKLVHTFERFPRYIECVDSSLCYAAVPYPLGFRIYSTTDQGLSWNMLYGFDTVYQVQEHPLLWNIKSMKVADKNNIYLTFFDNYSAFMHSSDGGRTFEKKFFLMQSINNDPAVRSNPPQIIMMDSLRWLIHNSRRKFYYTDDGWKTFDSLIYDGYGIDSNRDLYRLDKDHFLFFCGYSVYESSLNDSVGKSMLYKYNINTHEYSLVKDFGVVYNSEKSRYEIVGRLLVIDDSTVISSGRTRNGPPEFPPGKTGDYILRTQGNLGDWSVVLDTMAAPTFGLQWIAFADKKNGFIVGQWGKILLTKDGGNTWIYDTTPEYFGEDKRYGPPNHAIAWAGNTAIMATFGGSVYRYYGDYFDFEGVNKNPIRSPYLYRENCNIIVDKGYYNSFEMSMKWTAIDSATSYHYQVARDPEFTSVIKEHYLHRMHKSIKPELRFLQDTKYYFRVRACILTDCSDWSDVCEQTCRMEPPKADFTICDSVFRDSEITLKWQNQTSWQETIIEISLDPDYSTTIIRDTLTTEEYNFTFPTDTVYYWRLKSIGFYSESYWTNERPYNIICGIYKKGPDSVREAIDSPLFPNPSSTYLILSEFETIVSVSAIDLLGNETTLSFEQDRVDISQLNPGSYVLQLINSLGEITTAKFIKE